MGWKQGNLPVVGNFSEFAWQHQGMTDWAAVQSSPLKAFSEQQHLPPDYPGIPCPAKWARYCIMYTAEDNNTQVNVLKKLNAQ